MPAAKKKRTKQPADPWSFELDAWNGGILRYGSIEFTLVSNADEFSEEELTLIEVMVRVLNAYSAMAIASKD